MRTVVLVTLLVLSITPAAIADVPADAPGRAAPIVVGHGRFTVEFPGDTNTCGFELDETVEVNASFRFFEDPDERPFVNVFHENVVWTFTRNNKSVVVARHATRHFPVLEPEFRESGLTVQIRLTDGGLVVRDAGVFVLGFDGTVHLVRGPHPLLEVGGESAAVAVICAELAS